MKATENIVIDGYDLLAETARLSFPDQETCGRTLNRGTAEVSAGGTPHGDHADIKSEHAKQIFPNTIDPNCPVIDLSWPTAGMFVASAAGVYMDCYQGVAQKLIDERHPAFERAVKALADNHLAFRREINTDDFVHFSQPVDGVHTSQELAAMLNALTAERFDGQAFRTFFSNSGAEAGEAAIKLAQIHAYKGFVRRYGAEVLARLMADLGIEIMPGFEHDTSPPEPLYRDYPFFVIGCDKAFHGRTLGVLNLTASKKAQRLGYGMSRWFRHIPFNGSVDDLTGLIDARPITEILDAPGGVSAVIDGGKIPVDLAAMFCLEVYQGEGGYRLADRQWLSSMAAACAERNILVGVDEVQSFGRTGRLYAAEHFDLTPDVIWMSKGAVVGATVARAELAEDCHVGWHSNTFGGGKLFDVNMAYTTVDTLVNHTDAHFEGRTYLENSRIKGEYVRMRLADLSAKHGELFPDFSGLGGMWGLTVRYREEIVETAWRMGAKLLGCGSSGELSRLRIILLTDVLTREVDQLVDVLDRVFTEVESKHDEL